MRNATLVVAALALSLIAQATAAQTEYPLSFQGLLTDTLGVAVDTPSVEMTFAIYRELGQLWSKTFPDVAVETGVFNVEAGGDGLDTVAFHGLMDLGITVGGAGAEEMYVSLSTSAFARALPGLYTHYRDDGNNSGYNVVGGADNVVLDGIVGATISGGGGQIISLPNPHLVQRTPRTGIQFGALGLDYSNAVVGDFGTVGGGFMNTAGYAAAVGGGQSNTADGSSSTIGGGESNTADGGGSTVAGGFLNTASGSNATVGGGGANTASGTNAVVPGGQENAARGAASMAAGRYARANHGGSLVWQDNSGTADTLSSSAENQFVARGSGGFRLLTGGAPDTTDGVFASGSILTLRNASQPIIRFSTPSSIRWTVGPQLADDDLAIYANGAAGYVITADRSSGNVGLGTSDTSHPLTMASGAHVTAGGVWTDASSRSLKTDFTPIDEHEILERLVALPLTQWRYRSESSARHLGPVAEDFYAAFELGGDDAHIAALDGNGVSMAAIKALHRMVVDLQEENRRLRERVERLER